MEPKIDQCELQDMHYDNKSMTYTVLSTSRYFMNGAVILLEAGRAYTFDEIERLAKAAKREAKETKAINI